MDDDEEKKERYDEASKAWEEGHYQDAGTLFASLGLYRDALERTEASLSRLKEELYLRAMRAKKRKDRIWAVVQFLAIRDYKDSSDEMKEIMSEDGCQEKTPEAYVYDHACLSTKRVYGEGRYRSSSRLMHAIRYQDSVRLASLYDDLAKRARQGSRHGAWIVLLIHLSFLALILASFLHAF